MLLSKSLPLALLFFMFHFNVSSSSSSSSSFRPQRRPETRAALLNLSNSGSEFNKSDDCCTWDWVLCDPETGHVIHLQLYPNETITPKNSLFSLIHLQNLAMYGSEYSDIELGSDAFDALTRNLTSLKYLELFDINMSSVPPASLMNLSSSLIVLTIQSCELSGKLPPNFFHFPNLKDLRLPENNLEGQIPSICSNCTFRSSLFSLLLDGNSFGGPIPSWIYALPNLEWLYLQNNLFTGEIGEFQTSSLLALSVSNNMLQGAFPTSLFRQMELYKLDLSSNNFTGIVELQELSKWIGDLDLSDNNLSVTYNSINCTFELLMNLRLSSCNLTHFPHFLRSSKQLNTLDLSNNQIQGIVPKWLRELNHLMLLDLHSNFFFGSLPNFPPSLNSLSASKNNLSGHISSSICNVTSLSVLDLSYNSLSGRIPPCIGNVSLEVLDLRSNKLHGEISESLFVEESQLHSLNLNENLLEGQLPRSLVNCTELEVLDLGINEFNDTFPDWLESLPRLQVLVLRANKFHGLIGNPKPELSFQRNTKPVFPFQNLIIMDLSHNDFTGDLPTKYFENFKAMQMDTSNLTLRYVGQENNGDFYYYQDTVRITMKGHEFELERILTAFTAIDFSCNNFTGEIPVSLGKLKSLKGLNLSHNALTGILPPSLGNLTNIEWLDLSSNGLVGQIPVELADIYGLSFLNLSHNHLQGPIPNGKQFNTFRNESFEGNLNLCGFPLPKLCGTKPSEPNLEQDDADEDDDDDSSNITNGFNWRIVMMGFASGLVIGISIGYILLYSNGKLYWISERILEEIEYRRAIRPKKRNARRSQRN